MTESQFLRATKNHVEDFFNNSPIKLLYHNLNHTLDVVQAVVEVGLDCHLNAEELEIALIAAWFHDIGYLKGIDTHEQESAKMAMEFLKSINYPQAKIEATIGCIFATKVPQKPTNKIEEVVCDADLAHLASNDYFPKAEKLRHEISINDGIEMPKSKWLAKSKRFFEQHHYFTNYGKQVLSLGKLKNYSLLVEKYVSTINS